MIYKIGIISKRYLIMFGILRWHIQLIIIVWSQIVHQAFNSTYVQGFQICTYAQYCPCRPREQTSSPPKGWVGVRVRVRVWVRFRVGSGVGLVWAAQPSFCADLHIGSRYT